MKCTYQLITAMIKAAKRNVCILVSFSCWVFDDYCGSSWSRHQKTGYVMYLVVLNICWLLQQDYLYCSLP